MKVKIECVDNLSVIIPDYIIENSVIIKLAILDLKSSSNQNNNFDIINYKSNNFTSIQLKNFIEYTLYRQNLKIDLKYFEKLRDFIIVADYLEFIIPNNIFGELKYKIYNELNVDMYYLVNGSIQYQNIKFLKDLLPKINERIKEYETYEEYDKIKKLILNITKNDPLNEKFQESFKKVDLKLNTLYRMSSDFSKLLLIQEKIKEYKALYEVIFVEIFSNFNDEEMKEYYRTGIVESLNKEYVEKKKEDYNPHIKSTIPKAVYIDPNFAVSKKKDQAIVHDNIEKEPEKIIFEVNKFGNLYDRYSNIIFKEENNDYVAIGVQSPNESEEGKIKELTRKDILYLLRHKMRYDIHSTSLLDNSIRGNYKDCKNKSEKKEIKMLIKRELKDKKKSKNFPFIQKAEDCFKWQIVDANGIKIEESKVEENTLEETFKDIEEDIPKVIEKDTLEDTPKVIEKETLKDTPKVIEKEVWDVDEIDLDDLYYDVDEDEFEEEFDEDN